MAISLYYLAFTYRKAKRVDQNLVLVTASFRELLTFTFLTDKYISSMHPYNNSMHLPNGRKTALAWINIKVNLYFLVPSLQTDTSSIKLWPFL